MKIAIAAIAAVLLVGISACTHQKLAFEPTQEEMLTQKEKFALIDYVRGFVLNSRRLSQKLNPAEKDIIARTDPKVRIHYTAPKKGRLNIIWEFFDGRALSALCEGELQTKNNPSAWQINITTGERSGAESIQNYGRKTR